MVWVIAIVVGAGAIAILANFFTTGSFFSLPSLSTPTVFTFVPAVASIIIWLALAQGARSNAEHVYNTRLSAATNASTNAVLGMLNGSSSSGDFVQASRDEETIKNMGIEGINRLGSIFYKNNLKANWFIPIIGFAISLIMFFYLLTKKENN